LLSGTVQPARRTTSGNEFKYRTNPLNRSKRNGFYSTTSNYHKGYIAAAEYGINPEVQIYKYPGKDLIHKFKADTTIKVVEMVFSRDGKYLLMIGGIPDFKISIFDLETS